MNAGFCNDFLGGATRGEGVEKGGRYMVEIYICSRRFVVVFCYGDNALSWMETFRIGLID